VLFVFDLTKRDSFEHIDEWVLEVSQYVTDKSIKVLVGNKADMEAAVSEEEAKQKARSLGYEYFAASAKSDLNIKCIFYHITRALIDRNKESGIVPCSQGTGLGLRSGSQARGWCCSG
jgi:Ras-related protein Rab-2A